VKKAKADGQDPSRDPGIAERNRIAAESARNTAEQLRQSAESTRGVREQQREALHDVWHERERVRDTEEAARVASEKTRIAAERDREAAMDAMHATAQGLGDTLDRMEVVEDLRRTLRNIRDVNKLDAN
jgi:cell fate (sporulation/competence/biofilm development) regulator YmcA (YheA/YmcA/DUF963 family)